jgi:cold shock protein
LNGARLWRFYNNKERTMAEGRVKWFSDPKGFGFVEANGKDYFVHYKEVSGTGFKSLKEGDRVTFEPSESSKGPVALDVSKI